MLRPKVEVKQVADQFIWLIFALGNFLADDRTLTFDLVVRKAGMQKDICE